MEMAWTTIDCVALHVPDQHQCEFWITQWRVIAHADRLLRTMRILEVEDDASETLVCLGNLYVVKAGLRRPR